MTTEVASVRVLVVDNQSEFEDIVKRFSAPLGARGAYGNGGLVTAKTGGSVELIGE